MAQNDSGNGSSPNNNMLDADPVHMSDQLPVVGGVEGAQGTNNDNAGGVGQI